MNYVLDANVLIDAYRRYYAFDLAPKFWGEMLSRFTAGEIGSIDHVRNEILRGNDLLATWVGTNSHGFVQSTDDDTVNAYRQIIQWAQNSPRYTSQAKAELASVADGWIVAYAKARGCTVTTMEQPHPLSQNRVMIPDICNAFSVSYVNTYDMMRRLDIKFV